jgi:outer membrane protein assembly factor BamB
MKGILAALLFSLSEPGFPEGNQTKSSFEGGFAAAPVETWAVRLPGPPYPAAIHTELGGPLIYGAYIYLGSAASDALYVLERHSGRLVRELPTGAPVQAAPVADGGQLFFTDTAGTLYAWSVDPEKGPGETALWSRPGSAPVLAPVALDDNSVYLSNVGEVVSSIDRKNGELRWRHAHKLDASRTAELELYGAPTPLLAPYTKGEGTELVVGFSDGIVAGLDAVAGEVRWQRRVGEGRYPDVIASGVLLGDDVIVAGFSEPLVAIHRGSRNVRWRVDVGGSTPPSLGGGSGTRPERNFEAGAEHRFVFHGGSDGIVRCLDGRTGAVAWSWDSGTDSALSTPMPTEVGLLVGAAAGGLTLLDPSDGAVLWNWQPGWHPSGITASMAVEGRQVVVVTNAGWVRSFVSPLGEAPPRKPKHPVKVKKRPDGPIAPVDAIP